MAQGQLEMLVVPGELFGGKLWVECLEAVENEAPLDARHLQKTIHFLEDGAKLTVIFGAENARKCWTKLGLKGDDLHVLYLSFCGETEI